MSVKIKLHEGFESPFTQSLNPRNRWIVLAHKIPWDMLAGVLIPVENCTAVSVEK
jgi:hypothetical protein